ncbi:MAG: GspH/FimT family pseudopilin [Proteobacteria bacterium]|nr:GspH/FimT family pseudopilin [Pseudomonadota bacterium]
MSDEDMNTASTACDPGAMRQSGITIIEILVALTIASILIGLALPAFNNFVAQRTLTSQVNDFLVSIQYARSEAGRRGTTVSLRAVNAAAAANEWGPGWCVVVGTPVACPNDGTELRNFASLGTNTLDATGALAGIAILSFNSRGLLLAPAAAGVLNLCNPTEDVGREVSLNAIGRVSVTWVSRRWRRIIVTPATAIRPRWWLSIKRCGNARSASGTPMRTARRCVMA